MLNNPKQNGESRLSDKEQAEADRLLDKSQEAFILAIELFNRPTICYRVEGCAFFLCNAWELMLKAYLMKRDGYRSIFYKNKPGRSIALDTCINRIMTNENDPVRINLETVEQLRNESTHFVVEEYNITYGPIFQANIHNYDEAIKHYHNVSIADRLPDNYMVLTLNRGAISPQEITARYTQETATHMLLENNVITTQEKTVDNVKYAAEYKTDFRLTKSTGIPVHFDKNAEIHANVLERLADPQSKYPYLAKPCINLIQKKLGDIQLTTASGTSKRFNSYHFNLFVTCYQMKQSKEFCYVFNFDKDHTNKKYNRYLYSEKAVALIVKEVRRDPEHIIETLKKRIAKNATSKKRNKGQPQEQGNSRG